mgnify:CR=1 FL=1
MNPGDQLIEAIQSCGHKARLVVAGGGSGAVHALLSHPGASRFVVDVRIPYSPESLAEFLGETPESACSEETARRMAAKALDGATLGVACTAALQTNRERRGADRAHVCFLTADAAFAQSLEIPTGSRREQEAVLSGKLLRLLADFVETEK